MSIKPFFYYRKIAFKRQTKDLIYRSLSKNCLLLKIMILYIVTIYYYGFITTLLLSFVVLIAKKSRGKKIGKKIYMYKVDIYVLNVVLNAAVLNVVLVLSVEIVTNSYRILTLSKNLKFVNFQVKFKFFKQRPCQRYALSF